MSESVEAMEAEIERLATVIHEQGATIRALRDALIAAAESLEQAGDWQGGGEGWLARDAARRARVATQTFGQRITHGRHCTCGSCAQEDWTNADLAPCGMHGSDCPALYRPWGPAGSYFDPARDTPSRGRNESPPAG